MIAKKVLGTGVQFCPPLRFGQRSQALNLGEKSVEVAAFALEQTLKAGAWGGYAGFDAWFANANNASLGVMAAYNELVPDFERLFEREGRDFNRFFARVQSLAALPKAQRRAELKY